MKGGDAVNHVKQQCHLWEDFPPGGLHYIVFEIIFYITSLVTPDN